MALSITDDLGQTPDDVTGSLPYQVVTLLGGGPHDVTYLAQTVPGTGRYVALKILGARTDVSDILSRYRQLRPALARLRHPHLSPLVDAGPAGPNQIYIASEYVTGAPLVLFSGRPTATPRDRLAIAHQVVAAVAAAHACGIAHAKLDRTRVKVTDSNGVVATVLGFGTSLIVDGPRSVDVDLPALVQIVRDLGIPLGDQAYPSADAIRDVLRTLA